MGAIAGVVYPDVFQVTDLTKPMLAALHRRSALPSRSYTWKRVQLGTIGHAIGANEKHSVIAILDGLITNLADLRSQLLEASYRIATEDPAEVLVHAYDLWDIDFLKLLDGEFTFAILDERKQQLILARDRIGKAPLYWYRDEHLFLFASELNALLATGAVPQAPAVDGIAAYLSLGYLPQDFTPVQGVSKLLPAHYLTLHLEGHTTIHSYWSYSSYFTTQLSEPIEKSALHLDALLRKSAARFCPSELPVGCLVSGGLGSASIAYYATQVHDIDQLSAYSAGFQKDNEADIQTATEVTSELKLTHKYEFITPSSFLDDFVRVVWHLGEPLADPFVLVTWRLARLASSETRTTLSGMGADELLAGHSRYTSSEQQDYIPWAKRLIQPGLRAILVPILNLLYQPLALTLLKETRVNPWQAAFLKSSALFDKLALKKASPTLAKLFDPDTFLHKFYRLPAIDSVVSSFLYLDIKTRLPELYIYQFDRLMSAFGLDWHAPFLSKEIVEYLARLPEPESLLEKQPASPLKFALRGHLPDAVIDRPKQSRPHFLCNWANTPQFRTALELLKNGICVDTGFVSGSWLRRCCRSDATRSAHFLQLWGILTLEVWMRLFINRPIRTQPPEGSLNDLLEE